MLYYNQHNIRTLSAKSQKPLRKFSQTSTLSFNFLCKYGQFVFEQQPWRKNLHVGILDKFISCDKRHLSAKHSPFMCLKKN